MKPWVGVRRMGATVAIDPRQLQVTNAEQVLSGYPLTSATVATQMGDLRSRDFVVSVMNDLKLFDDPEFNAALTPEPVPTLPTFLQPLERLVARLPSEWLIASGLAWRLELASPSANGLIRAESPLPEALESVLERLRSEQGTDFS